jgi:hypothetical protein
LPDAAAAFIAPGLPNLKVAQNRDRRGPSGFPGFSTNTMAMIPQQVKKPTKQRVVLKRSYAYPFLHDVQDPRDRRVMYICITCKKHVNHHPKNGNDLLQVYLLAFIASSPFLLHSVHLKKFCNLIFLKTINSSNLEGFVSSSTPSPIHCNTFSQNLAHLPIFFLRESTNVKFEAVFGIAGDVNTNYVIDR